MESTVATERLVIVDDDEAQIVAYPDSLEERLLSVAGSNEAAQWSFSFSVRQAAFIAGLQADFLRPM